MNQTDPDSIDPVTVNMDPGKVTTVKITVEAEDTTHNLSYTIDVNRSPRSYAQLSNLSLSTGTLIPAFDPKVWPQHRPHACDPSRVASARCY